MASAESFALAETMAAYDAIQTGRMPASLSVGMIADCGYCDGDQPLMRPDAAWACLDKHFGGVCSEAGYPLARGKCPPKGACVPAFKTAGLELAALSGGEADMAAAASKGVLLIGVDASSRAFEDYQHGIIKAARCGAAIGHLLTVVGYSDATTDSGSDAAIAGVHGDGGGGGYWLLQNSWGADWGDHGYIKIEKSAANTCGIYTYGFAIRTAAYKNLV